MILRTLRYQRQRNLVISMNRKAKKSLFNKNYPKTNSKGFWNICKPLFSEKGSSVDKRIKLIENGQLVSDDDIPWLRFSMNFITLFPIELTFLPGIRNL